MPSTLVTLTYTGSACADPAVIPVDLAAVLAVVKGKTGVWTLDFNNRGVPHYHLVIDDAVDAEVIRAAWWRRVGDGALLKIEALAGGTDSEYWRSKWFGAGVLAPDAYAGVELWGSFGSGQLEAML